MLRKVKKSLFVCAIAMAALPLAAGISSAEKTNLRIQTHYSPEQPSGKLAAEFIDNIQRMSGGEIEVEMYYASSVTKSVESFDAAVSGIIDCDMTSGAYQTGKNPAFQFTSDIMGGYDTVYQQLSWLYYGGGSEALQKLYNEFDMEFIGWWAPGAESLSSSKPLRGPEDLKDWKFRSPPGLETKIFQKLGAKPIVMDFTEIFTALESGIIDGADASGIANNIGLGLYDIVQHTTYPGFHSMPSDHLACNKSRWDSMPDKHKAIMKIAMESLSLRTAMKNEVLNNQAAAKLREQGVNMYDWSPEDRQKFREAAQASWDEFATTPEAKELVKSHKSFLKQFE